MATYLMYSVLMSNHTAPAPCDHTDRDGAMIDGIRVWVCIDCGDAEPMTPEENDWSRTDVLKCARCLHSEEFGGPLTKRTDWLGITRTIHVACL